MSLDKHQFRDCRVRYFFYCMVAAMICYAICGSWIHAMCRDPATMSFQTLFDRSDLVIVCKVMNKQKSPNFADLDAKYFDEYIVTVKALAVMKGGLKRNELAEVVGYESNGNGMPGNFGSTLHFGAINEEKRYLLFLRKRMNTWMPTTEYVDAGNSLFLLDCSGFCE